MVNRRHAEDGLYDWRADLRPWCVTLALYRNGASVRIDPQDVSGEVAGPTDHSDVAPALHAQDISDVPLEFGRCRGNSGW
jgi:hypothetical protein